MSTEMTKTENSEVSRPNGGETTRGVPVYRPSTDIWEAEDRVVISLDMPGVSCDGVDVTLERRILTIRGHVDAAAPEGYRQVHAEYGIGDFERVFTLSEDFDQDKIEASQKDGVLTLELPKAAASKPKKVEVKAA